MSTHIMLIGLQTLQGKIERERERDFTEKMSLAVAFQLIWSSGVDQIHVIVYNQYERMKERARASLLFSSLGPAAGSIIAGLVLQSDLDDYVLLFKTSVAILSLSFVVSWGWASND